MQIEDLEVVLKVAELGSITAAATHLDLQTATASAAVKRVEASLGVELFIRSTRRLRVSSSGERYLPLCADALATLQHAKLSLSEQHESISGQLRVAVSSDLGRNVIAPWLDELMEEHPNLSLRMHLSDSNIDFYRDALDMAIRYGEPSDSNLYGFKICNVPRLLCASPEYLKLHPAPQHPNDVLQHHALFYQLGGILNDVWHFHGEQHTFKIKPTSIRAANDGDMVHRWCLAGKGLAMKSALDIADDLLTGRLQALLPDYPAATVELWLICPSRQIITPSVRLLRDTLREKTYRLLSQLADQGIISKAELERLD